MTVRLRGLRMAASVGMVLAAGAALAACQGGSSSDDAGSDGPQTSATAPAAPGATTAASPADTSTPTPAPPVKTADAASSGAAKGSADAPAAATRCRTADLGFSYGPDSGAQAVGSPGGIDVVLTNKGSAACTLKGFPGVDIIAKDGTHWPLARQSKTPAKVTLKPAAEASFEITYLPFDPTDSGGSRAFHATSLLITPPDETHPATLKWDGFADVMDQSAATHPGTYVGPIVPGR